MGSTYLSFFFFVGEGEVEGILKAMTITVPAIELHKRGNLKVELGHQPGEVQEVPKLQRLKEHTRKIAI